MAERRRVSILFADLVAFTALVEGRDPEDVQELLARYFDTCRSVIARYGGTIEKFIGDAVMAVWGAPVAREDDAERAVRAALDLVAAVAGLGRQPATAGLAARAAVASGEAAVAVGAVGQGMVAGDVVNTASRLQGAAAPGTVLIDQETFVAVHGAVACAPVGDVPLRGKRRPLAAWEARRVVALRRGEHRRWLPEGPLVGRDEAIGTLRSELRAARDDRAVRLVSILGEAGIGKSRIIWELEKYVDGIVEQVAWHHAASPAYGEGLAFQALADMVRQRARIGDGDGPAVARRRLAACLARYVPDGVEQRWIGPQLAALLGLGPASAGGRDEAYAAWRTFFERVADTATTVLVFDDLHWADDGLLDFVEGLASGPRPAPILVVAVARPDLRDRRPSWGSAVPGSVTLELAPLSREAMDALLRGLAPDLPPDLAGRVLDRAGGVPLFAVEILRMLAARGDLERRAGAYHVRRPPGEVTVPPTLHALVAARIDALAPAERALVRQAAVLGDTFRGAALAAVAGQVPDAIAPSLDRLARQAVLLPATDGAAPGDDHLQFSHALVREVAYATVARRDRRALHLAAADHYAGLGDPELSGEVASHVLAAYRAAPLEPADHGLEGRAVVALRTAADRAMAVHAPESALGFLAEALSVVTAPVDHAELDERAAMAAQAAALLAEAEGHARTALATYRALGDARGIARAAASLGSIMVERYDAAATSTLGDAVAELGVDTAGESAALADDPAAVDLLAQLARAHLVSGRMTDAVACADRALHRARRLGLDTRTADALTVQGSALLEDCRVAEGVELLRASLAVSEEHGLIGSAVLARSSLTLGVMVDDPGEALRVAGEGLEIATGVGLRDVAVRVASNWADAALETGAWDRLEEVLPSLDRADMPVTDRVDLASVLQLVGAIRGVPGAMAQLEALATLVPAAGQELGDLSLRTRRSLALLATGQPGAALAEAEAARRLALPVSRRAAILEGTIPGARAALWQGDLGRLEGALAEIDASGLRGRWIDGVTATLRAGLAARHGDVQAAITGYGRAAQAWRGLEVPFQASLGLLEAARLLPPGSAEADAAASAARGVLAGLGATLLLERLDAGLDVGA